MRRLAALLPSLALLGTSAPARAQMLPPEMVAGIVARNGVHPMAGRDGRIPFLVAHDGSVDAHAAGLTELTATLGMIRLLPSDIEAYRAAHPELRMGFAPPLRVQMDMAGPRSGAPAYRLATSDDGAGAIVGVIDTGLDVTHLDLRDASGRTRIAWLLDLSQGPMGKHPDLEAKYGCTDVSTSGCAVLDASDIDALIAAGSSSLPTDTVGHGTHVASIAAGNGNSAPSSGIVGMAPGATIVGVRATRTGGEEVDEGDAILGARFIFERAAAMGMPAVVNMSLGTDFGAHDGTSSLEQGLSSFVGPDYPGRSIAVAAGNSGGVYVMEDGMRGIHTEVRVAPGARATVPMRATSMSVSTVEGSAYIWMTWRGTDSIDVGLMDWNGRELVPPVKAGSSGGSSGSGSGSGIDVAIYNDVVSPATPLVAGSHGAVVWYGGKWPANGEISLLIEGNGTADAWVQGVGGAAPSASGAGQLFARAVKHGTVNIPATHPSIIAVGAAVNRASWKDANGVTITVGRLGSQSPPIVDSMAYFSGSGPTAAGLPKPDITAPGVFVAAAMSRDADPRKSGFSMFASSSGLCPTASDQCFVVDEHHAIASGTSMATPMVSGAVALLLARDPTLTQPQVLALLQAGARYPDGAVPYPFQMGPGALDVEGARLAYEAQGHPIDRVPDAAASWVVMAAPYVKPDPSQPVWGWAELRASDGTIADGFDDRDLALQVDGGAVVQPLTRMAPGLWRFGIAAQDGSGGGTVRVRVALAGEVLGREQALPIGPDYFMATEGVQARGGSCAMRVADGGSRSGWPITWIGLAAAAWAARRRQRSAPPSAGACAYSDRE